MGGSGSGRAVGARAVTPADLDAYVADFEKASRHVARAVGLEVGDPPPDLIKKDAQFFKRVAKLEDVFAARTYRDGVERNRALTEVRQPVLDQLLHNPVYGSFVVANAGWLWRAFIQLSFDPKRHRSATDIRAAWQTFCSELWLLKGLQEDGRVFKVAPKLAHAFALADVPLPASELRTPFPFMLVVLPPDLFYIRSASGKVGVTEIVANQSAVQEVEGERFVALNLLLYGFSTNHVSLYYHVPLGATPTLQEDVQRYFRIAVGYNDEGVRVEASYDDPNYRLVNAVINTILYVTSFPNAITASNKSELDRFRQQRQKHKRGTRKKRRAAEKLKAAQRQTIYIVGRSFELEDQRVKEAVETGQRIRTRHVVRGHWKRQRHGPGRTSTKLIFIQPYWRGPNGAEAEPKTYMVR